jgi:ketosteroid isomerase-like protein
MKSLLSLLVFLALLTGCKKMDETVTVSDLNKQFISAWNSKDSEKVISFLADDVQFLQGEMHFKGKSEVADKWVKATVSTINDLKTYVTSTGSDEKIAYEGGTFSVDVLPGGPNEPHATGEGNFILLWKKGEDGAWKLSYAQLEDLPLRVKNP